MGSFWGEFLLGVLAFGLGIVLSITSEYFVFYGLIICGFFKLLCPLSIYLKLKKEKMKMVYQ